MKDITQELLMDLFDYNKDTGEFTRKKWARNELPVGSKRESGHIQISVFGKKRQAHRLAWIYVYGDDPDGLIDHINRNPSDNRICNLRICTRAENKYNSQKKANGPSVYKGVQICRHTGKYMASITVNRKQIQLGRFDSEVDAAKAYDAAAVRLAGEFACTNFEVSELEKA